MLFLSHSNLNSYSSLGHVSIWSELYAILWLLYCFAVVETVTPALHFEVTSQTHLLLPAEAPRLVQCGTPVLRKSNIFPLILSLYIPAIGNNNKDLVPQTYVSCFSGCFS